jgi:hypothetical protein
MKYQNHCNEILKPLQFYCNGFLLTKEGKMFVKIPYNTFLYLSIVYNSLKILSKTFHKLS